MADGGRGVATKVQRACDACHRSKSACMRNAGAESCTSCERRGVACVFSPPKKRGPKSGALKALQQEVLALRAQLDPGSGGGGGAMGRAPPRGSARPKRPRADSDDDEDDDEDGSYGGGGGYGGGLVGVPGSGAGPGRQRRAAAQRALRALQATHEGDDTDDDVGDGEHDDGGGGVVGDYDWDEGFRVTGGGGGGVPRARRSPAAAPATSSTASTPHAAGGGAAEARRRSAAPVVPWPAPVAVGVGGAPVSLWPPVPRVSPLEQELHYTRLFMRCSNALLPMVCKSSFWGIGVRLGAWDLVAGMLGAARPVCDHAHGDCTGALFAPLPGVDAPHRGDDGAAGGFGVDDGSDDGGGGFGGGAPLEDAVTLMAAVASASNMGTLAAGGGGGDGGGAAAPGGGSGPAPRYYRGRPLATPTPRLIAAHYSQLPPELREPAASSPAVLSACAAVMYGVLAVGARLDMALVCADEYAARVRAALAACWDVPCIETLQALLLQSYYTTGVTPGGDMLRAKCLISLSNEMAGGLEASATSGAALRNGNAFSGAAQPQPSPSPHAEAGGGGGGGGGRVPGATAAARPDAAAAAAGRGGGRAMGGGLPLDLIISTRFLAQLTSAYRASADALRLDAAGGAASPLPAAPPAAPVASPTTVVPTGAAPHDASGAAKGAAEGSAPPPPPAPTSASASASAGSAGAPAAAAAAAAAAPPPLNLWPSPRGRFCRILAYVSAKTRRRVSSPAELSRIAPALLAALAEADALVAQHGLGGPMGFAMVGSVHACRAVVLHAVGETSGAVASAEAALGCWESRLSRFVDFMATSLLVQLIPIWMAARRTDGVSAVLRHLTSLATMWPIGSVLLAKAHRRIVYCSTGGGGGAGGGGPPPAEQLQQYQRLLQQQMSQFDLSSLATLHAPHGASAQLPPLRQQRQWPSFDSSAHAAATAAAAAVSGGGGGATGHFAPRDAPPSLQQQSGLARGGDGGAGGGSRHAPPAHGRGGAAVAALGGTHPRQLAFLAAHSASASAAAAQQHQQQQQTDAESRAQWATALLGFSGAGRGGGGRGGSAGATNGGTEGAALLPQSLGAAAAGGRAVGPLGLPHVGAPPSPSLLALYGGNHNGSGGGGSGGSAGGGGGRSPSPPGVFGTPTFDDLIDDTLFEGLQPLPLPTAAVAAAASAAAFAAADAMRRGGSGGEAGDEAGDGVAGDGGGSARHGDAASGHAVAPAASGSGRPPPLEVPPQPPQDPAGEDAAAAADSESPQGLL